ncbi:MAG: phosphoribosyltransferase family protein [Bacteroidota bacterium]
MFKDRYDAAMDLALKLEKYKGNDGIVLAIPRGGVPIGYVIAKDLGFPLEIILSKKIGHPSNPEYAIGSVSLDGMVINDNVSDVSTEYISNAANKILQDLKTKFKYYMGDREPSDLKNKTVIIVDDGIATGSTIIATINSVRKMDPKEIIVAAPVASPPSIKKIESISDEMIILLAPQNFMGVGQFYYDFSQVEDEEVILLLKEANANSKLVKT